MLDSEYPFQQNIMHIYENTHKYMGEKGSDFSLNKGKKIKMSFSFNNCTLKMSKFEVMHFQHRLCESSFTFWIMNHNVLGFVFDYFFFKLCGSKVPERKYFQLLEMWIAYSCVACTFTKIVYDVKYLLTETSVCIFQKTDGVHWEIFSCQTKDVIFLSLFLYICIMQIIKVTYCSVTNNTIFI